MVAMLGIPCAFQTYLTKLVSRRGSKLVENREPSFAKILNVRTGKVAQWVEALAIYPEHLSSIPETLL